MPRPKLSAEEIERRQRAIALIDQPIKKKAEPKKRPQRTRAEVQAAVENAIAELDGAKAPTEPDHIEVEVVLSDPSNSTESADVLKPEPEPERVEVIAVWRPDPLLTIDQVADYLGVPRATLYTWRTRKRGPRAIRVGRELRYRARDVEAWLDSLSDVDESDVLD